jgi:hypothetical protein
MSDLQTELTQFTGTENYHRFNLLFRNVLLTDGAKHLADAAGAYWLMDVIASHLPSVQGEFAVAILSVDKKARFALCGDLDGEKMIDVFATQEIPYTDFPLPSAKLWVQSDGENWVIMLPSEY